LEIIFFGNAFLQLKPSPQSNKIGQKEPTPFSDFRQKTDKKNRPHFPIFYFYLYIFRFIYRFVETYFIVLVSLVRPL